MIILAIIWNLIVLCCQLWLIRVAFGLVRFIITLIAARKVFEEGEFKYYDSWSIRGLGYSIFCKNKRWEVLIGRPQKEEYYGNF